MHSFIQQQQLQSLRGAGGGVCVPTAALQQPPPPPDALHRLGLGYYEGADELMAYYGS